MLKKNYLFLFFILALAVIPAPVYSRQEPPKAHNLIVFYSPTCHRCEQIRNELMPDIEKRFGQRLNIEYRDISDIENYKFLLKLEEKSGIKIKNAFPIFYLNGQLISAVGQMKEELMAFIENSLKKEPFTEERAAAPIDLTRRFLSFSPWAVSAAGLIDGANPCAFTVIVFFISFLALQGYQRKKIVAIGLTFILAVFLTYLFIGIGLFNFLYRLQGFWWAFRIVNLAIGIFSIVLGLLALYDFLKFRRTGVTEGLFLQLPQAVKNQIHSIIGLHYRKTQQGTGAAERNILRLFLSAFITGFLVSILEAVCTGQVYLPTIAFVLKTSYLKMQALGYLLLYNTMFVVPLLVIFGLALLGTSSTQFSRFLKRNLLAIKLLMALLFFGLGIFIIKRI